MRNRVSAQAGVSVKDIKIYDVVMTVKDPESDRPLPVPAGTF